MREKFEKLPEIAKRLNKVEWDDDIKRYRPRTTDKDTMACARVNGALYAYQEQQKIIDEMKAKKAEHIERMNKLLGVVK